MYLFRERLKELREEYRFDQKQMGEKLNFSASAYGYYEQGRNEPSLETLVKIAETFNVSTDYLLGLSNTRNNPVYYTLDDRIKISSLELETIKQMKELSLLQEISQDPKKNVERLNRCWQFIKNELNQKS